MSSECTRPSPFRECTVLLFHVLSLAVYPRCSDNINFKWIKQDFHAVENSRQFDSNFLQEARRFFCNHRTIQLLVLFSNRFQKRNAELKGDYSCSCFILTGFICLYRCLPKAVSTMFIVKAYIFFSPYIKDRWSIRWFVSVCWQSFVVRQFLLLLRSLDWKVNYNWTKHSFFHLHLRIYGLVANFCMQLFVFYGLQLIYLRFSLYLESERGERDKQSKMVLSIVSGCPHRITFKRFF